MWWNDRPYVSVAQRRAEAERKTKALLKKGRNLLPVKPSGRKITTTFWGDSWCKHLESYSDFSNRLGRGRSYIRNGSVIDLQIRPGTATALVCGSDLYEIEIDLSPLKKSLWQSIKSRCAGQIGSLVDLLQGKLSGDVMSVIADRTEGLFPRPEEIRMKCSCPDYAYLCKHLAAVLYGIGNRFDERPELFFQLRKVDHLELVSAAGASVSGAKTKAKNMLAEDSLADIFGIELAGSSVEPHEPAVTAKEAAPRRKRKATTTEDLASRTTAIAATRPVIATATKSRAIADFTERKSTTKGRAKAARSSLAKKKTSASKKPAKR